MINWNRAYRPQTIAELHLEVVRQALQSMIKDGALPQVFVFAGPKGTGKTSTARIIGALVNNPKNKTQVESIFFKKEKSSQPLIDAHDDDEQMQQIFSGNSFLVQEMDAASNRGIDEIRSLKERIALPPSYGLVSVYILDEAHMLTTEAFNALLKILEEPPAHALFILATTELHKIPETVLSRARMLQFKKATELEIVNALSSILKKEKVTADKDVLGQIARMADGSFRDAVKLAEAAVVEGKISKASLETVSATSQELTVIELIEAIVQKELEIVVSIFQKLRETHVQEVYFHRLLLDTLHQALLQNLKIQEGRPLISFEIAKFLLTELSHQELSQASPLPLLPLEMKIVDILARAQKKSPPAKKIAVTPLSLSKDSPTASDTIVSLPVTSQPLETVSNVSKFVSSHTSAIDGNLLIERWSDFIDALAQKNATISALLRSAQPLEGEVGRIKVAVFYKFHQEQLISAKFSVIIRAVAEELLNGSIEFEFVIEEPAVTAELLETPDTSTLGELAAKALL